MKIRVSSFMLSKALDHYRDAIIHKFTNSALLTPANIVLMEQYLRQYQSMLIKRETNPVWAIALKLIYDPRRGIIDVQPHDQADFELI